MWSLALKPDAQGVHRPVIYCSVLNQIVFSETQLNLLHPEWVETLCQQHNRALIQSNKEQRDLIKSCYREATDSTGTSHE